VKKYCDTGYITILVLKPWKSISHSDRGVANSMTQCDNR